MTVFILYKLSVFCAVIILSFHTDFIHTHKYLFLSIPFFIFTGLNPTQSIGIEGYKEKVISSADCCIVTFCYNSYKLLHFYLLTGLLYRCIMRTMERQ